MFDGNCGNILPVREMQQPRILVIGVGSIGERHARCLGLTGRCEVGIVETRPDVVRQVAERYSIAHAFTSLDDALRQGWTAAVVATPANTHLPIARTLAERKLHLLIEKPLSTSLEGVTQLTEAIRIHDLVAGVAYVHRANPLAQKLRELVACGRFGAPRQLYLVSGQHFPTYRPAYRQIYYARRDAGGGAIQDALTHLLNLGEWILGPVTRLAADAAHQQLDGVQVEDTAHVIARHGDVLASYTMNQYQAPNETVLTIVCAAGTLRLSLQKGELTSLTAPGGDWQIEHAVRLERDDLFVAQAHAFLDAVEGRRAVLCTIDDAAQTLRTTLAVLDYIDQPTNLRPV